LETSQGHGQAEETDEWGEGNGEEEVLLGADAGEGSMEEEDGQEKTVQRKTELGGGEGGNELGEGEEEQVEDHDPGEVNIGQMAEGERCKPRQSGKYTRFQRAGWQDGRGNRIQRQGRLEDRSDSRLERLGGGETETCELVGGVEL